MLKTQIPNKNFFWKIHKIQIGIGGLTRTHPSREHRHSMEMVGTPRHSTHHHIPPSREHRRSAASTSAGSAPSAAAVPHADMSAHPKGNKEVDNKTKSDVNITTTFNSHVKIQ